MQQDPGTYTIESPWGAVAGFFLIQCFGYVTLHGFRMFVNIGRYGSDSLSIFNADCFTDRILLPFWGLMWIFAFIAFEVDIFRRLSIFWRKQSVQLFLQELRTPTEILKALFAVLSAVGFAAMILGYYPFPSRPIPTVIWVLFWLFGWGVSGFIVWGLRRKPAPTPQTQEGTMTGAIMGFIIGAVFFMIAYFVQPGLFYFHGMIGLGVMTMIACQVLFRKPQLKRMPNKTLRGGD